jgi:hypothetical protein
MPITNCYWCNARPAAIALAEHNFCVTCAHDLVNEAAQHHEAERARIAERRARVPRPAVDAVVDGAAGVMLGDRFVRGLRAHHFRGGRPDLASSPA